MDDGDGGKNDADLGGEDTQYRIIRRDGPRPAGHEEYSSKGQDREYGDKEEDYQAKDDEEKDYEEEGYEEKGYDEEGYEEKGYDGEEGSEDGGGGGEEAEYENEYGGQGSGERQEEKDDRGIRKREYSVLTSQPDEATDERYEAEYDGDLATATRRRSSSISVKPRKPSRSSTIIRVGNQRIPTIDDLGVAEIENRLEASSPESVGIPYHIVRVTSEDGLCPAVRLEEQSTLNMSEDLQGWATKQHADWPQTVEIGFGDCFRVDAITVRSHSFRIPRKIGIYITGSRQECGPYYIGHLEFSSNLVHNYTAQEEKTFQTSVYGTGVLLRIEGCFKNKYNLFQQANITKLDIRGVRSTGVLPQSPAPVPSRNDVRTGLDTETAYNVLEGIEQEYGGSPKPRRLCPSTRYEVIDSFCWEAGDGYDHGTMTEIDVALLSVGVPMDLVSDTAQSKRVERKTSNDIDMLEGMIVRITELEERNQERDDLDGKGYELASRIKRAIDNVVELGIELAALRQERLAHEHEGNRDALDPLAEKIESIQARIHDIVQNAQEQYANIVERQDVIPTHRDRETEEKDEIPWDATPIKRTTASVIGPEDPLRKPMEAYLKENGLPEPVPGDFEVELLQSLIATVGEYTALCLGDRNKWKLRLGALHVIHNALDGLDQSQLDQAITEAVNITLDGKALVPVTAKMLQLLNDYYGMKEGGSNEPGAFWEGDPIIDGIIAQCCAYDSKKIFELCSHFLLDFVSENSKRLIQPIAIAGRVGKRLRTEKIVHKGEACIRIAELLLELLKMQKNIPGEDTMWEELDRYIAYESELNHTSATNREMIQKLFDIFSKFRTPNYATTRPTTAPNETPRSTQTHGPSRPSSSRRSQRTPSRISLSRESSRQASPRPTSSRASTRTSNKTPRKSQAAKNPPPRENASLAKKSRTTKPSPRKLDTNQPSRIPTPKNVGDTSRRSTPRKPNSPRATPKTTPRNTSPRKPSQKSPRRSPRKESSVSSSSAKSPVKDSPRASSNHLGVSERKASSAVKDSPRASSNHSGVSERKAKSPRGYSEETPSKDDQSSPKDDDYGPTEEAKAPKSEQNNTTDEPESKTIEQKDETPEKSTEEKDAKGDEETKANETPKEAEKEQPKKKSKTGGCTIS